jgi:hypothetical protein
MTKKPLRRFELCTERLETLEDVKKVLKAMHIRIDMDNPYYEELEYYFSTEVVPRGYMKVLEKVGYEKINTMTLEEIEKMGLELLNENEETN